MLRKKYWDKNGKKKYSDKKCLIFRNDPCFRWQDESIGKFYLEVIINKSIIENKINYWKVNNYWKQNQYWKLINYWKQNQLLEI